MEVLRVLKVLKVLKVLISHSLERLICYANFTKGSKINKKTARKGGFYYFLKEKYF